MVAEMTMGTKVITVMDITPTVVMETTKDTEMISVSADMAPMETTMTSDTVASLTGLIPLRMTMTLSSVSLAMTSTTMDMVTNPTRLGKEKETATSTTSHTDLVVTKARVVREAAALMTIDL
jgi:hypothetical protein